MTASASALAMQGVIRRDPVGFCRKILNFARWSKQREILESVRDHKRTAVRSGHGVGKTAISARAALWFMAAHPYSRVITTAPTWSQVKEQFWREIHVAHSRADAFFDGQLDDTRLELGPDWFMLGISTDRPERFAGHHAEHLLLVVDEASGVSEDIFEAAETFLTSPGAKVLMIGNPTVNSGTFHAAFHRDRADWSRISISALDSPASAASRSPMRFFAGSCRGSGWRTRASGGVRSRRFSRCASWASFRRALTTRFARWEILSSRSVSGSSPLRR